MPLFYMGLHPMPPFVELCAPHRTDFSYTRKVSKSVCKGTPLAQPRGGNVTALRCRLPPQCPKGHVPPFALRVVYDGQGFALSRHSVAVAYSS